MMQRRQQHTADTLAGPMFETRASGAIALTEQGRDAYGDVFTRHGFDPGKEYDKDTFKSAMAITQGERYRQLARNTKFKDELAKQRFIAIFQ